MNASDSSTVRLSVALMIAGCAAMASTAASAEDIPPTAYELLEDFTPAALVPETWQPVNGSWSANNGTYNSIAAAPTALAVVHQFPVDPDDPSPQSDIVSEPFILHARILNQRDATGNQAGLVFLYQDALNYQEVVIEPVLVRPELTCGFVVLRRVSNGAPTELLRRGLCEPANWFRNWFELEILRAEGTTTVKINGERFPISYAHDAPAAGRLGLITHDTLARFDNVTVSRPFGDQPFNQTFFGYRGGHPPGWSPLSGSWSGVSGAIYKNADAGETGMSQAPITNAGFGIVDYVLRAKMLNPNAGSNTRVGIFFARSAPDDYYEVVFSPTGIARLNRVSSGTIQTIATGVYDGGPNTWFDAKLVVRAAGDGSADVSVDGVTVFENVPLASQEPASLAAGAGVITHNTPGSFDNFSLDYGEFKPFLERFSGTLPDSWVRSGAWNTAGGTLNSTSVGASDIVTMDCCRQTNFAFRARLRNEYGNSGNLIGLVYNYQPAGSLGAGDHYEVLFSPAGEIYLDKFIQGVRYRVATTTHNLQPGEWFKVALTRRGRWTGLRVNDQTVFDSVLQSQLGPGEIGVVSRWTLGHFDNLSVTERVDRSMPFSWPFSY